MHDAFRIWDDATEPLASVEARIHDGVPVDTLRQRGAAYVETIVRLLPPSVRPNATVVEVGPGVGYIMEAFAKRTGVARVTGLDVAPAMVARARERLARDGAPAGRFEFVLYDGVSFPWPDESIDIFYSVATIQHIPKPFAYNVLFEMQRCLKPGAAAVVHLLSWDLLKRSGFSLIDEIRRQVRGDVAHWHHFYDATELEAVAVHGIAPSAFDIVPADQSIWLAWTR